MELAAKQADAVWRHATEVYFHGEIKSFGVPVSR